MKSVFHLSIFLWVALPLGAQNRIGTGEIRKLYEQHCAACHGKEMEGGLGGSLLLGEWKHINDELGFVEYVKQGNLPMGMPAFEGTFTDEQLRSLEILIAEVRHQAERAENPVVEVTDGIVRTQHASFRLETVADALDHPWAVGFLPNGKMLVTERSGPLLVVEKDGTTTRVSGVPEVWQRGQGGMLEVGVHPDYAANGWVYLGFSAKAEGNEANEGITKVVRGRIRDFEWVDEEVLFEIPREYHSKAGVHFGTRFVFQDGYLFFGIGDRGNMQQAQDLTRPNGKIHRIHDDGRIPEDNPFSAQADAYPTLWTYGNRNPQGLVAHPTTGAIWESEHGPRGGDEINLIEAGKNYGWPVITHGMNYGGTPITDKTAAPGMEQPVLYWTPSIAVCGIDFYTGDDFPAWTHHLFAGGLASQELHRLAIEGGSIRETEIILKDEGRIRDVGMGNDGYLYLVLNKPDKLVRLVPSK